MPIPLYCEKIKIKKKNYPVLEFLKVKHHIKRKYIYIYIDKSLHNDPHSK